MSDHETAQTEIKPVALNASPRTLALIAGGGLVAGTLIVVGAIMPAEFNADPLGIGKLTGISRLWAPETENFSGGGSLAFAADAPKQSHTVEIPLGAAEWQEAAVEYKVAMVPGQSIFYRWSAVKADGTPVTVPVEVDQHGHDIKPKGEAETVVQFAQERRLSGEGSLTAPIAGIFGWYFRNHDPDPITIRLEIEGYYTLVPPGEPGNEFRILPHDPGTELTDEELMEQLERQ